MKVTVVGSGTLVPEPTRVSACHVLEGSNFALALDVGPGAVRQMEGLGIAWCGLTHLVFSHFHVDHLGGLPDLLAALKHACHPRRHETLSVIGPPGIRERVEALARSYGSFILEPGFPLEVNEIGRRGEWVPPGGEFELRTHPAAHTPEAVAVRLQVGDVAVGYTGDTGPMEGLAEHLTRVDVLIAECSFADPPPMDTHLTPDTLGALASRAAPDHLFVTHVYPGLSPDTIIDGLRAAGFGGRIVIAEAGDCVTLP
jgi:ribonuclease BN (tRNA processing enzyme)